jgi:uncharacterized membrane protein YcgQ (UPF0703/DUF1980 family)
MKLLARTLAPLTLLEWGAILAYFYFSGRLAAFLHPMFRPLVLITGLLLIASAACVALFPEEECAHGHDDSSLHEHDAFSAKSLLAFLILFLPFALAAIVSPDDYGATIVRNRGLVEDIRGLPAVTGANFRASAVTSPNESASTPARVAPLAQRRKQLPEPINASGGDPNELALPQTSSASEPPLPASDPVENEDGTVTEQVGDATVTYENDFLKPNKQGNIQAQVTDLLYAAQEPGTRKDFEGKRVELIGQFVSEKTSQARQSATTDSHSFHLLRLVMVCCAADMMPAAVKVQPATKFERTKEMGWLKIAGVCHFRPRAKEIGDDGIDYGSYPEPVITADQITTTKAPKEKYIY